MKRIQIWLAVLLMIPALSVWAEPRGGGVEGGSSSGGGKGFTSAAGLMAHSNAVQGHAPVVINMNHGTSGGHNRNFPSQQPVSRPAPRAVQQPVRVASYGKLQWSNQPVARTVQARPAVGRTFQRPNPQNYARPGFKAAVVVHHHPYMQGYVRKKLQKLGVSAEPALITERAEIIHTDRAHSTIRFPQNGPNGIAISASIVSPRHFNDDVVRNQMMVLDSPEWRARINMNVASENQMGHYYWHNDGGTQYCHYMDDSGYHWYGWYSGNQYFWTRFFGERWWTYDADYDRWCFWNNGFWWWQDPYHVGDLYCYSGSDYIPCNSADDQIVVNAPADQAMQSNMSPDGTRIVKVDSETQDAFLYDTANPATFAPVYLASGVQTVQFSDTSNGRPLEIILKLNDGSYDMFDSQGNAYGPGTFDQDQANDAAGGDSAAVPSQAPDDSPAPPPDGSQAPPDPSAMQ